MIYFWKVSGDGDLLTSKTSYNAVYISQKESIKRDWNNS